jgi:protein-tyrosine phosphatase
MDATNVDDLHARAATIEQKDKVVMMGDYIRQYPNYDHVPDPYYEGSEGFELVLDLLEDACRNLLDSILQQNNISQ